MKFTDIERNEIQTILYGYDCEYIPQLKDATDKIFNYLQEKVSQVEPEVMVNFADLVDLLTDIEKHLDELYELAVIPEHLVSTYGNSQMNIGQRILELKSKISA